MTNLGSRDLCNPPLIIRQATWLPQARQIRGFCTTEQSRHSADPPSSVAERAEVTGAPFFIGGLLHFYRSVSSYSSTCHPTSVSSISHTSPRNYRKTSREIDLASTYSFLRPAHIENKPAKWPTSPSPQPTSARTRMMRTATGSLSRTASTTSPVRFLLPSLRVRDHDYSRREKKKKKEWLS